MLLINDNRCMSCVSVAPGDFIRILNFIVSFPGLSIITRISLK